MDICSGLDPLTDCKNAPNYYGYGTYAASVIAGRRYGVAKNATIYSGAGVRLVSGAVDGNRLMSRVHLRAGCIHM
jgi:hypothetical protein